MKKRKNQKRTKTQKEENHKKLKCWSRQIRFFVKVDLYQVQHGIQEFEGRTKSHVVGAAANPTQSLGFNFSMTLMGMESLATQGMQSVKSTQDSLWEVLVVKAPVS